MKATSFPPGSLGFDEHLMCSSVPTGCILVALWTLLPATARATCGEECDTAYSSDIDDCRLRFGDGSADAMSWRRASVTRGTITAAVWMTAPERRLRCRPREGGRRAPSPCGAATSAAVQRATEHWSRRQALMVSGPSPRRIKVTGLRRFADLADRASRSSKRTDFERVSTG
jgi:hypothetical protein